MLPDPTKHAVDVASAGVVIGTLAGLLPSLAALVSIIWGCIRIYETKTFQAYLAKRRAKRGKTP